MATDPIKIGLLLPSTGVDSTQGTDTAKGFELYLKQVGGHAGEREIRLIKEDDQAKPDVALVKIKKLVEVGAKNGCVPGRLTIFASPITHHAVSS